MRARRLLPLLFLCLSSATLLAQKHEEQMTVEVVDVPVYVYGDAGPIRNLQKSDFDLYVNGKRQTIDYFDTIDVGNEPPSVPGAVPDLRRRRIFLFMFDLSFTRPFAIKQAREAAMAMVDNAQPGDLFGVATLSPAGASFLCPFSNDRLVVKRAIHDLSPSAANDPLMVAVTAPERSDASQYNTNGSFTGIATRNPGRGAEADNILGEYMAAAAPLEKAVLERRARDQADDLALVSTRMGELEGDRHVIFFSHGALALGVATQERMFAAFHASNVFLHSVDMTVKLTLENAPLRELARGTGGQFIHGTNDIAGALQTLSTEVGVGYRLGFKPGTVRKGDNTITVKVHNIPRRSIVTYRPGFSSDAGARDGIDPLRLADIILNDTPQSGTPPAIELENPQLLMVHLPAALLARQYGTVKDAQLLLYIFDTEGHAVDYRERTVPIPATAGADIIYREHLKLPPGSYVAKSLLRIGSSLGFTRTPFVIPEK
jgi:VWFA-related protein